MNPTRFEAARARLELASPLQPIWMAGLLLYAGIILTTYYMMSRVWARAPHEDDVFIVLAVTLLAFPGAETFGRFTTDVLLNLIRRWGMLTLLFASYAEFVGKLDRPFLVAWGTTAFAGILVAHMVFSWVVKIARRLQQERSVVIVGINEAAVQLGSAILGGEARGQTLAGFFDDRSADRTVLPQWGHRLGTLSDVGDYVSRRRVACVYVALPASSSERMKNLMRQAQDSTASIYFVPNITLSDAIQCRVVLLGGIPTVAVCETPLRGWHSVLKRCLDLTMTIAALPLLVPVMVVIAVLIRLTSEGPALFRQRRYGLDGEEIMVWKFRTMSAVEDGDQVYRQATRTDNRVTPLGNILRRTSLDELPQFINVLAGTMSIVGPRPHAIAVNERCRKLIPRYMLRHKVKPGITGWAQVNGHRGGDDLESLRSRTECDIQYLKSWSLGLDLQIMCMTAVLLLGGDKNAY